MTRITDPDGNPIEFNFRPPQPESTIEHLEKVRKLLRDELQRRGCLPTGMDCDAKPVFDKPVIKL